MDSYLDAKDSYSSHMVNHQSYIVYYSSIILPFLVVRKRERDAFSQGSIGEPFERPKKTPSLTIDISVFNSIFLQARRILLNACQYLGQYNQAGGDPHSSVVQILVFLSKAPKLPSPPGLHERPLPNEAAGKKKGNLGRTSCSRYGIYLLPLRSSS